MVQTKRKIRYKHKSFLIIILVFFVAPFIYNTARYQKTIKSLEERKIELEYEKQSQESQEQLYKEHLSLEGKDVYLEYMAHKYLGYINEGEKIVVLHPESALN